LAGWGADLLLLAGLREEAQAFLEGFRVDLRIGLEVAQEAFGLNAQARSEDAAVHRPHPAPLRSPVQRRGAFGARPVVFLDPARNRAGVHAGAVPDGLEGQARALDELAHRLDGRRRMRLLPIGPALHAGDLGDADSEDGIGSERVSHDYWNKA